MTLSREILNRWLFKLKSKIPNVHLQLHSIPIYINHTDVCAYWNSNSSLFKTSIIYLFLQRDLHRLYLKNLSLILIIFNTSVRLKFRNWFCSWKCLSFWHWYIVKNFNNDFRLYLFGELNNHLFLNILILDIFVKN